MPTLADIVEERASGGASSSRDGAPGAAAPSGWHGASPFDDLPQAAAPAAPESEPEEPDSEASGTGIVVGTVTLRTADEAYEVFRAKRVEYLISIVKKTRRRRHARLAGTGPKPLARRPN